MKDKWGRAPLIEAGSQMHLVLVRQRALDESLGHQPKASKAPNPFRWLRAFVARTIERLRS